MNHQDKEKSLWEEIVKDLRAQGNVAEYGFETYISELSLKKDTGTKLIIEYPAGMLVEWIEFYYAADITEGLPCFDERTEEDLTGKNSFVYSTDIDDIDEIFKIFNKN